MKIITVKLEKGKIIGVLCLVGALALFTVGAFCLPPSEEAPKTTGTTVKTESQRQAFFESFDWLVSDQPLEIRETEVPTAIEGETVEFEEMQQEAGLGISQYLGQRVQAFTYGVENHITAREDVRATLWVKDGTVIAGYLYLQSEPTLQHSLTWKGEPLQVSEIAEGASAAAAAGVADYPTD